MQTWQCCRCEWILWQSGHPQLCRAQVAHLLATVNRVNLIEHSKTQQERQVSLGRSVQ